MNKVFSGSLLVLLTSGVASCAQETRVQDTKISVDASKVLNTITPWLAGSCIEDVNHEIYGGLYDQRLFGESFEEPPPNPKYKGWKTLGGEWRGDGTSVTVNDDRGAKLVSEETPFTDGVVTAEIRFVNGNGDNAGLLARVSNPGMGADNFDGYEISLSPGGKRLILGKHRHDWQPLQDVAVDFDPRGWTKLRVEMQGARIRIYLGESATPAIDFTDPNAPLLSGTFALRTWGSNVSYRDVRLQKSGETSRLIETGVAANPVAPISGMWDAVQVGTNSGQFSQDADNPFNGQLSQKIVHGEGAGVVGIANNGLNRWGISAKKGQRMAGRLYLRSTGLGGAVTVSLQSADGQQTYASQKINKVSANWAKYAFSLNPNATDAKSRFVVSIDKPGALWVDQAVLMGTGAAQFKGLPYRADIGEAIQNEGIRFLRYGGTMVNAPGYRWKKMIGDPDKRPPYRGHWYPYSTNGFGIEDFVRFCEAAKIKSTFAINIKETAQDAADLVEYLNGATSTPWGKRRAENGHPAPYNIDWIEIGNEEVLGGDNGAEYDHYVERFLDLAKAIHAKDPKIKLICSAWWRPDSPHVERVFKAIQGHAAYWDLHVGSDDANSGVVVDRDLAQMQALWNKWVPGTQMKCVIFEENGGLHNQQRALGHATTINAVRRHGDFCIVSCAANALQPEGQNDNGWDQGQIFFTPDQVWGMPPFYATQMYDENHQPLRVAEKVEGARTSDLDVTATRSEDGKTLVLHVVNISVAPKTATIALSGFSNIAAQAKRWTLAGELNARNSPGHTVVQTVKDQITGTGTQFDTTFAAHSYTILRLNGISK